MSESLPKYKLHIVGVIEEPTPHTDFNHKLLQYYGIDVESTYIVGKRFHKGGSNDPMWFDEAQVVARNEYLDLIKEDEFFLILDYDEVLCGSVMNFDYFMHTMVLHDMYTAFVNRILANGKLEPRPRLLRKKKGMQYFWQHDMIIIPDEVPEKLLFNPHEFSADKARNQKYNFIHLERKNSLIIPYIQIAHYKPLYNLEVREPGDNSSRYSKVRKL